MKDSDVVIFDEATCRQSTQSIERIEALFERRFEDKICIIIYHRPIKNLKLTRIIKLRDVKRRVILRADRRIVLRTLSHYTTKRFDS